MASTVGAKARDCKLHVRHFQVIGCNEKVIQVCRKRGMTSLHRVMILLGQ